MHRRSAAPHRRLRIRPATLLELRELLVEQRLARLGDVELPLCCRRNLAFERAQVLRIQVCPFTREPVGAPAGAPEFWSAHRRGPESARTTDRLIAYVFLALAAAAI
jgi:hypothetical protein